MSELVHSQLYQVRTFSIDVDVYDVDDMNQVKYGFLQILDGLGSEARSEGRSGHHRLPSRDFRSQVPALADQEDPGVHR